MAIYRVFAYNHDRRFVLALCSTQHRSAAYRNRLARTCTLMGIGISILYCLDRLSCPVEDPAARPPLANSTLSIMILRHTSRFPDDNSSNTALKPTRVFWFAPSFVKTITLRFRARGLALSR
jgi:hypothetical protein